MKRTIGELLRVTSAWVLCTGAAPILAQDVTVQSFTSGTTISSSAVNQNFSALANKGNNNALRIQSLENATGGQQYQWLGYTSANFDSEGDYGSQVSGYHLSKHCKAEFGPTAFVASDLAIESVIKSSDDFSPPAMGAYVIFNGRLEYGNAVYNPFFSNSSVDPGTEKTLYPSGRIAGWETNRPLIPVACVSYQ